MVEELNGVGQSLALLLFVIVPTLVIVSPISSCILYFIIRDKKKSIIGSIIGSIVSVVIGLFSQVFWYNGLSSFAPFVTLILILILLIILTVFIGLIVIKILWR